MRLADAAISRCSDWPKLHNIKHISLLYCRILYFSLSGCPRDWQRPKLQQKKVVFSEFALDLDFYGKDCGTFPRCSRSAAQLRWEKIRGDFSQLIALLLSSTLDTVLTLVKLRVQRLFESSVVTLLANIMFIPFISSRELLILLWYSAVYKNVGLNDNHFLLLVLSKHWPQLSIPHSRSNYLTGPRS